MFKYQYRKLCFKRSEGFATLELAMRTAHTDFHSQTGESGNHNPVQIIDCMHDKTYNLLEMFQFWTKKGW